MDKNVPVKEEGRLLCGLHSSHLESSIFFLFVLNNNSLQTICSTKLFLQNAASPPQEIQQRFFFFHCMKLGFVGTYFLISHNLLNKDPPAAHC